MSTIRRQIIELLEKEKLNALDISQILSVREKEVYEHLDHIRRTLARSGQKLKIYPYVCLACGYVFKERHRLNRPGRCPVCKEGHIRMASYSVVGAART